MSYNQFTVFFNSDARPHLEPDPESVGEPPEGVEPEHYHEALSQLVRYPEGFIKRRYNRATRHEIGGKHVRYFHLSHVAREADLHYDDILVALSRFDDKQKFGCYLARMEGQWVSKPEEWEGDIHVVFVMESERKLEVMASFYERLDWARENLSDNYRVIQSEPYISSSDAGERVMAKLRFAGED